MPAVIIAIQNGASVPINLVGKWLTTAGFEIRTIHAYAGQPLPSSVEELQDLMGDDPFAALIPLGGSMGALDDEDAPWLPTERALIRDCVAKEVPVLGICLGAQLLGVSLDGEIAQAMEPEIGLHSIRFKENDDPIFGVLSDSNPPTIQWHQDVVSKLPTNAISIATSEFCSNQVFRVGGIHYGVQFHPEADPTIVRMWERKGDQAYQRSRRRGGIVDEVVREMPNLEMLWEPIITKWAAMVSAQLEIRSKQRAQHR